MESAELCGVSTLPGGGCHWVVGARAAVMGRVMILSDPRGSALVVLTAQCSFARASPSVTRSASGTCVGPDLPTSHCYYMRASGHGMGYGKGAWTTYGSCI